MADLTASISFTIYRDGADAHTISFDRPIINVGKLSTSNLRLDDINVSRKHAVIEMRENGEWRITDLGSTNGTFVNDERIVQAQIKNGDRVRLGESSLEVHLEANQTLAALKKTSKSRKADEGGEGDAAISGQGGRTSTRAARAAQGGPEIKGLGTSSFYDKKGPKEGDGPMVLEVALLWGDTILSIEHYKDPQTVVVGEEKGCRFTIPSEVLGRTSFNLVEARGSKFALNLTNPQLSGDVLVGGAIKSLQDLKESSETTAGFYPISQDARARLKTGDFTLLVSYGPMPKRIKTSPLKTVDLTPIIFMVLSLILHSSFLIIIQMLPEEQLKSSMDPGRRRAQMMKVMKMTQEEEEEKKEEEKDEKKKEDEKKFEEKSDQLVLEEQVAADQPEDEAPEQLLNKLNKKRALDKSLASLSDTDRKKKLQEVAATTGAAAVLNDSSLLNSILENDSKAMMHDGKKLIALAAKGDQADPFAGGGALDPFGGTFDGGAGGFVGSSSVGGAGGGGGPGGGLVSGLGKDRSRGLKGVNLSDKAIRPIAIASQANVSGQLDRATVQRIIRRNLSGIRWCYQDALQRNANLNGKVTLAFTILPTGSVANPSARNSSISDSQLMSCITRKMTRWRFPSPKNGGIVSVSYPLILKTR
jgi:hypothetical protein